MEEYEDLSKLKADLKAQHVSTKQLYDSIQALTNLINDMFTMFKNAEEQMKLDEKEQSQSKNTHEEILKRLDQIIEQNKTIAKGMVDVSDLLKEELQKLKPHPAAIPQKPSFPYPPEPRMPSVNPPPRQGFGPGMQEQLRQQPSQRAPPPFPPPFPRQGPERNVPPPPEMPKGLDDLDFDFEEPKKKKKGFHLFKR